MTSEADLQHKSVCVTETTDQGSSSGVVLTPCATDKAQSTCFNFQLFAATNRRLHTFLFTFSLLILVMPVQPVAAFDIKLVGVPKDLREVVLATIEQPDSDDQESIAEFISDVPELVRTAMQSEGYYNSKVAIEPQTDSLTVTVQTGPPVKISQLIVIIEGDARIDGEFMPVIGQIPLRRNKIFRHDDYEKAKDILFDRGQDRGYFDMEFKKSQVRISRKKNTAEVHIQVDSDDRYTFATVEFKSDYFSDEFLRNYVPFEYGDPYESASLAELTRDMQNTGFFGTVKVIPIRGDLFGQQVPIRVEVERRTKNLVGVGVGFATDTSYRGKLTWNKPLVNKRGHSFDAELGVSTINQNLSFQYRVPRNNNPLYNFWSFETGILNEEVEEQRSFLSTVNIQRIRRTKRDWTESLFIRWERERYELGDQRDRINLLLPGFSYAKNRSTGFPFPVKGYSVLATFFGGLEGLGSDINFHKSVVNFKYLKSISKRDTFIVSAQYGAISASEFSRVPTSQRFFVGGDRTIRGFPFRTLSPVNDENEAIGGRYQEVVGIEYNRRFKDKFAFALFTDAGRAFNNFDAAYQVGAGFGLRWYSPVGPFRIDFAFGVSEDDPPFELHLSLGPEL